MSSQHPQSPYLSLTIAVLAVSLGSILVRVAAAPALAVSFYRIFLASVFLAPFAAAAAGRSWPALTARQRALLIGCGVALGLHFATWIASLSYTSVAASVLLVNLAPLFTVVFSRVFLGETPRPPVLAAIAVALVGAGLIAAGDWSGGAAPLRGDALALVGAAMLSIYHVIGRGLRDVLPLGAYVLGVWSVAAASLALLALGAGVPLAGYDGRTFAAFLALALFPTLAGHGLVNRALRALPAPTVGLFMLGEPVGASALAYGVFGEVPGLWTVGGGVLILLALAIVVLAGNR
jgi:drug/metabolite transporter (DMT)-like permease